ncbi:nuclear transport factor 2 family protein [Rahnella sp. BCC 1045]|uniref:nuclear transport factor 2 family protein n=1 Tax=Rahnella sp. BCC 1045 TaxID=2816251 RepID=UPI001C258BA8|nr:nuclear transport factor 2 family protein [Rahnella sp. BCC 1045]MBU9818461.1 nuclear transport factor 2 family protein [Rahnella sp. BCC 1045]
MVANIHNALNDLLNRQDIPLETSIDRYFSPDYRQRTNGKWDDRTNFIQHIKHLRTLVKSVDIQVLNELREGSNYATRHQVTAVKRDGTQVVMEVYLFAVMDQDGRFLRIEETTLLLEGSEADRGMGSAR